MLLGPMFVRPNWMANLTRDSHVSVLVEEAATPFSRPTQNVHTGATPYIDEQSTSDEAVTRKHHNENTTTAFHVLVHSSCLSSNAYSRTHLPRYSQAHFLTISSGIRTHDTCKNILGNAQIVGRNLKMKVRGPIWAVWGGSNRALHQYPSFF